MLCLNVRRQAAVKPKVQSGGSRFKIAAAKHSSAAITELQ
jgi:hypothetical protein